MCLNPISIVNPSKYVSLRYRDPYLLQVPCGKCAECQSTLSGQWMYRSFVEFNDVLADGGFIYFDTLTYSNSYVPHLKDVVAECESDLFCFNREHLKLFFKRLRMALKRHGYNVTLRYFVSSEYGTNPMLKGQNRPHYHLLLYVYGDINSVELSKFVSDAWFYGRTDGIPFKSAFYVLAHNTIFVKDAAQMLRTANYVTKYVQKDCSFQNELNKRIVSVMNDIAKEFCPNNVDVWLKSSFAARIRRKLTMNVNQFHVQSLHYGESALEEFDLNQIFNDGCLYMPHFKGVKVPIVLPTYYKRKLFYRLLEIDGAKTWQLNELGVQYKQYRQQKLIADLHSRLKAVCIQHHLNYDCKRLAEYVMLDRGRIRADKPSLSFEDKLQHLDLFNYVTVTDKDNLLVRGLLPQWLGNSVQGYTVEVMPPHYSIKQFIGKYVILDSEREKELSHIYYCLSFLDKGKQDAYELKQRLTNLFKIFR